MTWSPNSIDADDSDWSSIFRESLVCAGLVDADYRHACCIIVALFDFQTAGVRHAVTVLQLILDLVASRAWWTSFSGTTSSLRGRGGAARIQIGIAGGWGTTHIDSGDLSRSAIASIFLIDIPFLTIRATELHSVVWCCLSDDNILHLRLITTIHQNLCLSWNSERTTKRTIKAHMAVRQFYLACFHPWLNYICFWDVAMKLSSANPCNAIEHHDSAEGMPSAAKFKLS